MRGFRESTPSSLSSTYRWVRGWQCSLNLFLLLTVLGLGIFVFRRALFFAVFVPVAFIPFSYARLRLHASVEHILGSVRTVPFGILFAGVGILLDLIMAAQFLTARSGTALPIIHSVGVSWVGAIWFSAHGLLFLGYVGLGLGRLGSRAVQRIYPYCSPRRSISPHGLASPARRQFLQHMGVLGVGAPFVFSLSGAKLSYDFRVEEREIVLPHWPRALDGLRVAHLSDIHVGGDRAMNRNRLLRVAALTNATRPDVVLHTGDFLTHRSGDFDAPLYEALAQIRAPYGQWACLGNHDFDAPKRLVRRLSEAGVTTLRNTRETLSVRGYPLEVAGIDYLFRSAGARMKRYAAVVRSWGPREPLPRLLLIHDPRAFATLPHGCADLVLSGHTHGGHVGIQVGRDRALTVVGLCGIPDQGLFRRGDMWMFVTRCVGFYGYPMRLGIPPEIALLTLRVPRRPLC